MRYKNVVTLAILIGLTSGLSACSGGDGISVLDRESTNEDQLPAYVDTQSLDVDSVRLAAESQGYTYFLAEGDEAGFCLIRISDQDQSAYMAGCGTGTGHVTTTFLAGTPDEPRNMALVTDGYATKNLEEEGWTRIQDNILVR